MDYDALGRRRVVRHNWMAYCSVCGKLDRKLNLDRLKVSAGACGQPITLAYVHRDCLPAVADFLEVEIPTYVRSYRCADFAGEAAP